MSVNSAVSESQTEYQFRLACHEDWFMKSFTERRQRSEEPTNSWIQTSETAA